MEKTKRFTELMVWKKSHEFVLAVYDETKRFPREELFGLTSQLRRATVSIPANIAEGSLEECYYYLILANDLGYSNTENLKRLLNEVGKLLDAYSKSILASIS